MLSYFPQKSIFIYLTFQKRRSLSSKYRTARGLHRICALNIETVCIEKTADIITIEVDKLIWKLQYTKVTLPSGIIIEIAFGQWYDPDQLVQHFAEYYLNRDTTRIRDFVWKRARPCSFENFQTIIEVSFLFIFLASDLDYDHKIFEYFRGSRFRKIKLVNASIYSLMDLKEFCIETDDLEVAVDNFWELPELEHLPSKPCVLAETAGDIRCIADRCDSFSFLPIGFTLRILYLVEELPIAIAWRLLDDALLADIKYTDGIKGHCYSIDNDKEMFIITKKYSFNPTLQNSYEAFATLQEAGKSVDYQEMCLTDKLIYFKLKWDNIQFNWSTRFGIFLAHLLRIPIDRISLEHTDELSRNFRIVNGIFTFLSYCHIYNLPILTISLQVLIVILTYFHILINLPNFFLTLGFLILISGSFALLDYILFPWKSYPERISKNSTQILCPSG